MEIKRYSKPWLKWYEEKGEGNVDINKSIYQFAYDCNVNYLLDYALNFYGEKITFESFFSNSRSLGQALLHLIKNEKLVVTMLLPNMPVTYYVLYGCSYIGAVINPVDIRTNLENIKHYINSANSNILFVHSHMGTKSFCQEILKNTTIKYIIRVPSPIENQPKLKQIIMKAYLDFENAAIPRSKAILSLSEFLDLNRGVTPDITNPLQSSEEVSVLMHTSGTTGKRPKTVKASDKNINFLAMQYMKSCMELERGQISIDIMPKWIFYGYLGIHMPLSIGMQVCPIIDPANEPFDKIIHDFQPQNVAGVPSHAIQLIKSKHIEDLKCIKTLGIGGDSMPVKYEEALNMLLQERGSILYCSPGYGCSENTSIGTANQGNVYKLGSVGIPFPDVDCMIIDAQIFSSEKRLVPIGSNQTGIICLGGNLMLGYDSDHENEYDEVIYEDIEGRKWCVTRDIGYLDEDGFLFFKNRDKDLIVRGDGFKVVPQTIETAVMQHDAVERCVVIGRKNNVLEVGEYPCCVIVLKDTRMEKSKQRIISKEIISLLKKQLPIYYLPEEFIFVDSIPITNMGKVDREKLKKLFL